MKTTTQELKNLFLGTATLITLVAWSTNSLAQTYDEGCSDVLNRTGLPGTSGHTQWANEASMDGGNYKQCTVVKDSQDNGRLNTRCGNLLISTSYENFNDTSWAGIDILDKNGTSWHLLKISDPNNLHTSKCSIQGDYAQETYTLVNSYKNDLLPIGKVTIRSIGITNYKITRPNF